MASVSEIWFMNYLREIRVFGIERGVKS